MKSLRGFASLKVSEEDFPTCHNSVCIKLRTLIMMVRMWPIIIIVVLWTLLATCNAISQDLVLPGGTVEAAIRCGDNANFDNCIIFGNLVLDGAKIDGDVHFNNTTFSNGVKFNASCFNGCAYFNNCRFGGKADFSYSIFNKSAYYAGTNFDESTDFSNVHFTSLADFTTCEFNNQSNFQNCKFDGRSFFWDSRFIGPADFNESMFNDEADFQGSEFSESAGFIHSTFHKTANFEDLIFQRSIAFSDSCFDQDAIFSHSYFGDQIDFNYGKFNGYVKFGNSHFNGNISFFDAEFDNSADFTASEFNGSSDFSNSIFKECAYFSLTNYHGPVDFGQGYFGKEAYFLDSCFDNNLSLINRQFIKDAVFEGTKIKGVLFLKRSSYNKLYIRWFNINDLDYDDSAYLYLLDNFKKLGYYEDFDSCYYEYRIEHRKQSWPGTNPLMKYLDAFMQYSYGYGKKPLNALLGSLLVIGLFGLFWTIVGIGKSNADLIMQDEYSSRDNVINKKPSHYSIIKDRINDFLYATGFSATVFLSGTKLFIDPPAVPDALYLTPDLTRKIYILERILGGLFSILLFITISGTVMR